MSVIKQPDRFERLPPPSFGKQNLDVLGFK